MTRGHGAIPQIEINDLIIVIFQSVSFWRYVLLYIVIANMNKNSNKKFIIITIFVFVQYISLYKLHFKFTMNFFVFLINLSILRCFAWKTYENYSIFHYTISTATVANATKEIDRNYRINWLMPHHGPTYRLGTEISILVKPNDTSKVELEIENSKVDYEKVANLGELIRKSDVAADERLKGRYRKYYFHKYHSQKNIYLWLLDITAR